MARTGVNVSANDSIVADNQVYVRGPVDPLFTGIKIKEPALNVNVHDNLIRNGGTGILTERAQARVGEVVDDRTFTRSFSPPGLPLERIRPQTCVGWRLVWLDSKNKPTGTESVIEAFDPETLRFKLREPHPMKSGDRFEVVAPSLNWLVHDNTVTGCRQPVVFDSHGSDTSIFRNNLIERGGATNSIQAISGAGHFKRIDNSTGGFEEKGQNTAR